MLTVDEPIVSFPINRINVRVTEYCEEKQFRLRTPKMQMRFLLPLKVKRCCERLKKSVWCLSFGEDIEASQRMILSQFSRKAELALPKRRPKMFHIPV